ncbi:unnamed protein product [Linum trigynum]|uniref:Transmembrane protein n=1 Tax=Linum trigynum TaxID=586398 RepID=A0AAV2GAP5_9ROSI
MLSTTPLQRPLPTATSSFSLANTGNFAASLHSVACSFSAVIWFGSDVLLLLAGEMKKVDQRLKKMTKEKKTNGIREESGEETKRKRKERERDNGEEDRN